MSENTPNFISVEHLWEALLSRQASQVQFAFHSLDAEQQGAVLAHLQRMVQEPGWQVEQRLSAQAALEALQ